MPFAETFSWKEGLDEPFRGARPFYAVLIFSILLGIGMDYLKINPVKALFWTAVINGVLAPFLLVGVLIAASDSKLMQGQPSSWSSRIAVGVVTLAMFGAAAAMFLL
jgi:Mn2+/Fe2+ NRAMP family transporter